MSARGLLLRVALRVRGVAEQIDIVDVVSRRWRVWSAAVLTVLVAIPLLLLVRVGLPSLVQARKTAGRMDDGGRNIGTDADLTQFAEWAFKNVAMAGSVVQVMEKFDFNYSAAWAVNRPHNRVNSLSVAKNDDPQRFAVVDTRRQSIKDLENMAKSYGVQAVGPFWRVDRATKGPQLWAHGYEERQPGPIEWMLFSGTDLVRTISNAEDPFESWAWRDALGLPANHPDKTPVSVNDLRVAHNIAVADKDSAREEDLRAKLAAAMGHPPSVEYTGGVRLRGVDIQKGSAIVVSLFWETDGGFKRVDANYQVKCKIVAPPLLWVGPTETAEKDMAPVDPIRPAAWKPGYFYVQSFVALHRIGREVCRGSFSSDLKPVSGDPNPILFTLD
jgi:hypothetical protein